TTLKVVTTSNTIPLIISSRENQTQGQIEIITWTKSQRIRKGLKLLIILWAIALFTVLIPILHFVLVPLFLLLGPLGFYLGYSQTTSYENGKGECPACKQSFKIVAAKDTWP